MLDAADVKQGLYGSFCPIIRRFPEENRGIEDEDLADLVDLGAEMSQDGPPSWVKMTLKDKIEKKDNIAHLAPLQWVEGPSRRKGGKRSKKESGFKPVGRGLPEVMEWTNKGVCDSNRILSIPFGMVYEIFVLYEQNSVFFSFLPPPSLCASLICVYFDLFLSPILGRKRVTLAKIPPR